MVNIPYKSNTLVLTGVLGYEVQVMFVTPGNVAPHSKSGKIGALAVSSSGPPALVPGVRTRLRAYPGLK